jgi:hypothetical protein
MQKPPVSSVAFFSTPDSHQEQPEKSISFAVTAGPGAAFSGFPPLFRLVLIDAGVQSDVPPLGGTNALACIE